MCIVSCLQRHGDRGLATLELAVNVSFIPILGTDDIVLLSEVKELWIRNLLEDMALSRFVGAR